MERLPIRFTFLAILIGSVATYADESKPGPALDLYGDLLPPGAIARLGTQRFRAADRIDHLAYSPDGKKLLSRGGGTITIWDAESGRKLVEYSCDAVGPLAWRADGSGVMLVTEPDGTQRLGDFTRERLKQAGPCSQAPSV